MTTPGDSRPAQASRGTRSRGSHKPRGGRGKYLRARGRGGRGRPAEFNERLLLEGEMPLALGDEEAAEKARQEKAKYGKREMKSNADQYNEEGSDGE
jgi:hypothetical protein